MSLRITHVGLRGVVGDGLTASHILDFAAAFGTFLEPGKPVLIGRDPRASGRMIREGVVSALMACGHTVQDLGIASSPVIQHAIRMADGAGGVSISASHNTAEWNALKFFGPRGAYLNTAEAGELLDIYHLRKYSFVDWTQTGTLRDHPGAIDRYLDQLAAAFDFSRLRDLRVVVDCCNGTSSLILRRLNERHGFNLILINEKMEGVRFAHDPVISKDTIALQLAPLMRPLNAQAGFQFDVDSDRVGIATENGQPISEELILPLLADWALPRGTGKIVITNLSSTALLEDIAARYDGEVIRVPVGRQAAIDALGSYRRDQIALAGEGTGAVMMPQFEFIYDGIASMLGILSLLTETGRTLTEIIESYPVYRMLKAEVPLTSPRIPELMMNLQREHASGHVDVRDGLRVSWPNRWFHVRVSQTEPVIRIIAEGKNAPPTELFESILDQARSLT